MRSLKYLLLGFFAWAIANMTPDAIERFVHSPYGAVADVRRLNFFSRFGPNRGHRSRRPGYSVGPGAEFLVPLFVSLRSSTRPYFPAEPVMYPSLRTRLYRLREMRQGLPLRPARGQTGHH
jgi:hypothetical protein